MNRVRRLVIALTLFLIFSAYILPHWFIIKESASIRSKFNIKRFNFAASTTYNDGETSINCDSNFSINRDTRQTNIQINCNDMVSEFKYKDSKLVSQNIKTNGKHFIRALTFLIENEELILPLPISSERLKNHICNILKDCNNVRYKRLGGVVNYQFFSKDNNSYYLIEKESFLPSALFIQEKNIKIEAKKYYAFSTNIKFPSVIEIQIDKQHIIFNVEEIEID